MDFLLIGATGIAVIAAGLTFWTRQTSCSLVNKVLRFDPKNYLTILGLKKKPQTEQELKTAYFAVYKKIPRNGLGGWWWTPRRLLVEQAMRTGRKNLMSQKENLQNKISQLKDQEGQWKVILELDGSEKTLDEIKTKYLRLAKIYHPDKKTGDPQKMREIQQAWEEAQQKFKK